MTISRWFSIVIVAHLGCSGGTEAGPDANDEPFPCETSPTPGTTISLSLGFDDAGVFVEIGENDRTPVVRGRQGFFMIVTKLKTNQALPADSFCLSCRQRIGAIGTFEGVDYEAGLFFRRDEADFMASAFLIMGGPELENVIDGATTTLTIDCNGHGVSGSVSRTVELYLDGDV